MNINGKKVQFPIFCPDATRSVLRAIDSVDMTNCLVEGVVVNTFHAMFTPGIDVIGSSQGIHKFMNWPGFVISDSGGFQMLSLIHKNRKFGDILEDGIYLTNPGFEPFLFTPELCIDIQFTLGSDLMVVLDDCPGVNATQEDIEESVARTVRWAKRCKLEFEKQLEINGFSETKRPLLLGVIQGGRSKELRKMCASALEEIGFDGYGFGGWPMTRDGIFDEEILKFVSELIPKEKLKYALGVGLPHEIGMCVSFGYQIFDCVLPSRDARHKRLYVFNTDPSEIADFAKRDFYSFLNIGKQEFEKDSSPISKFCECHTCKNFTKSYLHHLFKIKDTLAYRLATIHNLRMYSDLIQHMRAHIQSKVTA